MNLKSEASALFPDLHHLFAAYLHQDWTIDGDNLSEIFNNRSELQRAAPKIKDQIAALANFRLDHQQLDDLFYGEWSAGYEPDVDEGETWEDVLQQISNICDTYIK